MCCAVCCADKGAAPAPEDVPAAAEPATRALLIEGFVRPFTEFQVNLNICDGELDRAPEWLPWRAFHQLEASAKPAASPPLLGG